jgi:CubicO group peptidase (beta-lactamase class C family)
MKEQLDKWIDRYCEVFPFSGILRITKEEKLVYKRCIGLANREHGIPITPETRFRLYSMTKPFCAIALLLLCDRGLVDLDAHPGKYVPLASKLHPKVTLRTLLNHSSGLPDFSLSPEFSLLQYQVPVNYQNLFDCVSNIPMNFEPGTGSNYCNFNFFLASLVIEAVSGEQFESFIQREVFDALGMENTTIDEVSKLVEKRASGYEINGREIVAAPYLNINWMKGAGAAIGTAQDVYQLNRAIKNQKLLKKETWKQVFTPTTAGYGLGCTVSNWHGKERYTHNGGYYGFRTLHIQLPEDDFDIILLSNMGFGNARMAFSEAIYQIFYENYQSAGKQLAMDPGFAISSELAYEVMNPQRPAEISLEDGQEYVGVYNSKTSFAQVKSENGEWEIVLDNYKHLPVYPCGKDTFFHKVIDESYRFSRDEKGNLELMGMKKTH